MEQKRIAAIFFGQVKCFDRLYDNYHDHVGRHIDDISDYYVITSRKSHYENPRHYESSTIDYTSIFKYFNFTDILYDGLEYDNSEKCYFIREISNKILKEFGGAWEHNSSLSTFNSIKQISSLHKIATHLNRHGQKKYNRYLLIRSDIFFDKDFRLEWLEYDEDVLIPSFASWGGYNDRFAILNHTGLTSYCSRYLKLIQNPCFYHSEKYLKYVLEKDGIRVKLLDDMRFRLMRGDGVLTYSDY